MEFRDLILLFNSVWLVVISVATWLRKPGEEAVKAAASLKEQFERSDAEHRNRLTAIEVQMKHMPTSDELSELEGNVKAINERTEALSEGVHTVRETLSRIERYLLESKR